MKYQFFFPEATLQSQSLPPNIPKGTYIIALSQLFLQVRVLGGEINRSKNKRETTADS
jgi:hypothetical protein